MEKEQVRKRERYTRKTRFSPVAKYRPRATAAPVHVNRTKVFPSSYPWTMVVPP